MISFFHQFAYPLQIHNYYQVVWNITRMTFGGTGKRTKTITTCFFPLAQEVNSKVA